MADPAETAGPFPGDGTNSRAGQVVNVLGESGVERSDIRPSFAGMAGHTEGVPPELAIRVVDTGAACAPLAGRALYLWHCDALGLYSLYSKPEANYLRGLPVSDDGGMIRFQTVVPGCYAGRWTHMHFEVFDSVSAAVTGKAARLTSQFALPGDVTAAVYADDKRYAASAGNLGRVSLARDGVFRDNAPAKIEAMTLVMPGDGAGRYRATVTAGIRAA